MKTSDGLGNRTCTVVLSPKSLADLTGLQVCSLVNPLRKVSAVALILGFFSFPQGPLMVFTDLSKFTLHTTWNQQRKGSKCVLVFNTLCYQLVLGSGCITLGLKPALHWIQLRPIVVCGSCSLLLTAGESPVMQWGNIQVQVWDNIESDGRVDKRKICSHISGHANSVLSPTQFNVPYPLSFSSNCQE